MQSSLDMAPLSQETDCTGRNGLLSAQTSKQVVTQLGDISCIHCTSLQMKESSLYALSGSNVMSYMLCQCFQKSVCEHHYRGLTGLIEVHLGSKG